MRVTATELRQNLYRILDQALETGETIEIRRKRGVLHIVPEQRTSVWNRLEVHDVFPEGASPDIDHPWSELWDGEPELYDDSAS